MSNPYLYSNVITDDAVDMMLRQIDGRAIISKTGHIGKVTFDIAEGFKAEYMYEVTEDGLMFMQKMTPVSRSLGRIKDVTDMVKEITYDLKNYRHALELGLYEEYVQLTENLNMLGRQFEELFMICDPKEGAIEEIFEEIGAVQESLKKCFF